MKKDTARNFVRKLFHRVVAKRPKPGLYILAAFLSAEGNFFHRQRFQPNVSPKQLLAVART